MFSPRNTESPNPFRPALQYLVSAGRPRSNRRQSSSSGSLDSDGEEARSRMPPGTSNELRPASIPLVNISRSPSPFLRRPDSTPNSDTDDDDWGDNLSPSQWQLLSQDGAKLTGWKRFIYGGGAGQFFFNTPLGWQLYIGILVLWLGGCQIGLTIMNRIILWSGYLQDNYTSHTKLMPLIAGVYKFPYPLTTTLIELLITHGYLLLSAYITRWSSSWLNSAGLSGGVAPSRSLQSPAPAGFCGGKNAGPWDSMLRWTAYYTGGIAGGGLFEFDLQIAKTALPCAVIFVAKVVLSNLSFAYAQLQIYVLARIAIVPLALFFTYFLGGTQYSIYTLSSALTATLTLAIATLPESSVRVPWESIVAGFLSSIFVALYPVQLQRTYKLLLTSLIPQGDLLFLPSSTSTTDFSGSKEESRAYWRLLHYTSLLSILIFTPIVVLSGELALIWRNYYALDVFFHWLMVLFGGTGAWATFWATVALTRASSPLTTAFLFVPRAAVLVPVMARFSMPVHAWAGTGLCWICCAWFLGVRRREGREMGRLR